MIRIFYLIIFTTSFLNAAICQGTSGGGYLCGISGSAFSNPSGAACPTGFYACNNGQNCCVTLYPCTSCDGTPICDGINSYNGICPVTPAVTVLGTSVMASGATLVNFSDDSVMYILPDGSAFSWDIDGNDIANKSYNGTTPTQATFQENQAFDPNANKKYVDISFNGLPVFLIQQNGTVGFHGGQITPIAGLFSALAMMAVTPKTVSGSGDSISTSPAPTPEHPNAVNIDVTTINFDNMDFSEYENTATTTPQQIPESNLLYEKIMDATRKQSFPTASIGDTVIYENSNPTSYVNVNSDTLEVASVQPDNSITELTFDKNSFANAYNSDTGVVFTTTTTSPPSINPDGTTSVTTTTTNQGFITSQTTVTTDANGTTSFVTVTDPAAGLGGGITSVGGVPQSIDLSGVTSRLDKISNQLTKQNDFIDKMDKAVVGDFPHGIPSDASSADWTSWSTTWDNLKDDFDSVGTKGEELKTLINGGFSMSLTGGTIDTCPYNSTIDLLGSPINVSFDLCKVFSPMRVILYTMFYLLFVFSMISFFIKSLFRLV